MIQLVNQLVNQLYSQSVNEPINLHGSVVLLSISQSFLQSIGQLQCSTSQFDHQSISQSVSQPDRQSVSQSVSQSINQSINRSISQSVSQPTSQSVSQTIEQSFPLNCQLIFSLQADGGWSPWGKWCKCSKTCGTGSQYRKRTCTRPPPGYGGKSCVGSDKETRTCNTQRCAGAYHILIIKKNFSSY